jgi:DnaJ-class molecular chaperone
MGRENTESIPSETQRPNPGGQAEPDAIDVGQNVCRDCQGTGKMGAQDCLTCGGTGIVIEKIGGE